MEMKLYNFSYSSHLSVWSILVTMTAAKYESPWCRLSYFLNEYLCSNMICLVGIKHGLNIDFMLIHCAFLLRVGLSIHAELNFVMANLSVCLSVHHTLVLYQNECTYRQNLSTVW